MKNNVFDWSRFLLYLKKETTERRRFYLLILLGIYGGLTLLMWLGNLMYEADNDLNADKVDLTFIRWFITSIGVFLSWISASLMLPDLKTRPRRVAFLMTPASTLEKYLAHVLLYVVVFLPAYFICVQAADLTRFLLMKLLYPTSQATGLIDFVTPIVSGIWEIHPLLPVTLALSNLLMIAYFTLGAVIWPKYSFIKAYASLYVISMAFLIVSVLINTFLYYVLRFVSDIFAGMSDTMAYLIVDLLLLCACAALFTGAYRLLLRRELQPLKLP